jgi:hypothetical protein
MHLVVAHRAVFTAAIEDAGDAKLVGEFVTVDFDDEDRIATYLF